MAESKIEPNLKVTGPRMISLRNVTKVYTMGKVEIMALRGVSLDVDEGEMVAIIGASGSGKSTLMNIIGCLDRPTSGQYLLGGVEVGQLNDNELAVVRSKKLGFVFQDYSLLRRATAVNNVELPLMYSGVRQKRERAMESLRRVGLAERANHKPTELSGGEQQRVAIARALINQPKLILADEPTGNLDSVATGEIMNLFDQLNREGITIVMVTHEMELAHRCKRIVRVRDGKIVEDQLTNR